MKLDWPNLMRAGLARRELGGLGLLPDQFWRLTPLELRLMLGEGAAPLTLARLEQLAAAYPDKGKQNE
jgi:uncharacterized phage protein (TIGR02216 family)